MNDSTHKIVVTKRERMFDKVFLDFEHDCPGNCYSPLTKDCILDQNIDAAFVIYEHLDRIDAEIGYEFAADVDWDPDAGQNQGDPDVLNVLVTILPQEATA